MELSSSLYVVRLMIGLDGTDQNTALGLGFRTDSRVHVYNLASIRLRPSGTSLMCGKRDPDTDTSIQVAELHSKHGIILDSRLECSGAERRVEEQFKSLASKLASQKYAFVEEREVGLDGTEDGVVRDVWEWLKSEMQY